MNNEIEEHGFVIIKEVVNDDQRFDLLTVLGPAQRAGRRDLTAHSKIAEFARSTRVLDLVRPHLADEPVPVRAIFFDKFPETNWLVSWDQDLTLAVLERVELPRFGPWSVKDGIPHVQPPAKFLERMLTIRLHLDDADESNGALRVLPGSHRFGRLSAEQIRILRAERPKYICAVAARGRSGYAAFASPRLRPFSKPASSARLAH